MYCETKIFGAPVDDDPLEQFSSGQVVHHANTTFLNGTNKARCDLLYKKKKNILF